MRREVMRFLHGRLIQDHDDPWLGISGRDKMSGQVGCTLAVRIKAKEGREELKRCLGPHSYASKLCRRYNTLPVIKSNHPSYAMALQVRLCCTAQVHNIAMLARARPRLDTGSAKIVVTCCQLCARYKSFSFRSI